MPLRGCRPTSRPCSSTCESRTSSTRAPSRTPSMFRAATSSRASAGSCPTSRLPSSSPASPARARRSPRARSRSSATRTCRSLAGGFGGWKQNGYPWSTPRVLSEAQRARYARHTLIPEVGEAGQLRLLDSTVLLVGAGGLGSPAGLYLAAAGVGHDRDRRCRHRRRVEPAAPGAALDGHARDAQGRVGAAAHRGAQPRRARRQLSGAPDLREHRPACSRAST